MTEHGVSPARSWLESGDSIVKPHDEKPTLQMESEAKYLSDQQLFLQPRGPVDHHGHRHVGCLFHQGRDEEPAVFADVERGAPEAYVKEGFRDARLEFGATLDLHRRNFLIRAEKVQLLSVATP